MTKKELQKLTAYAKKSAFISESTVLELKSLLKNAGDEIELLDANQYFSTSLWNKQDLIDNLRLAGQPWDDASVAILEEHIDLDKFEDHSDENEEIQGVIDACVKAGLFRWNAEFIRKELHDFPVPATKHTAEAVLDWFRTVGVDYDYEGENPIEAALTDMAYL